MQAHRNNSFARTIRSKRSALGWSQERLAHSAGINIRTVQRVERGLACSGGTMQALADALNLDAKTLAELLAVSEKSRRFLGITGSQAVWAGVLLCLPGTLFVLLNVGYYELDMLVLEPIMGSTAWSSGSSHPLAPALFLGGPLLSLFLTVPHIVRLRVHRTAGTTIVDGLLVNSHRLQWAIALLALTLLATLLLYLMIENVGHGY